MIVIIDSSVVLAVALNEPERSGTLEKTVAAELLAPELLLYEVGNALSAMVRRKRLTIDEALAVLRQIGRIPMRLMPIELESALGIAFQHRLFAYDAYFLQCAKSNGACLMTLDRQMQRVGRTIGVEVLEL